IGTGEFYCEYGDFDYTVTVPEGMVVVGSGEVVNEAEVYSSEELSRLNQARKSDKTIFIRDKADVERIAERARNNKEDVVRWKSWHFRMQNSRDVAFGASLAY